MKYIEKTLSPMTFIDVRRWPLPCEGYQSGGEELLHSLLERSLSILTW